MSTKTAEKGYVSVLKLIGYWTIVAIVLSHIDFSGSGHYGGSTSSGNRRVDAINRLFGRDEPHPVRLPSPNDHLLKKVRQPETNRQVSDPSKVVPSMRQLYLWQGDPGKTSNAWRELVTVLSRPGRSWHAHTDEELQSQSITLYLQRMRPVAEADLAALKAVETENINVELRSSVSRLIDDVQKFRDNSESIASEIQPWHIVFTIRGMTQAASDPESPAAKSLSPKLLDLAREHTRLLQELATSVERVTALRESLSKRYPGESFSAP